MDGATAVREFGGEKAQVAEVLAALLDGPRPDLFAPDCALDAAWPWGACAGPDAASAVYAEIAAAFDWAERRCDILIAGRNRDDPRLPGPRVSPLVGWLGTIQGIFARPLCGIRPTGGLVHLRMAEVHHIDASGRLARSWMIPDLLDLMEQAGQWPADLPRPTGTTGLWPGPARQDGGPEGERSLDEVLAMHADLGRFDGRDLDSMPMGRWAPGFAYYAGGGIGMSKGLDGFRTHHQRPFLTAFPDRRGLGHFVRIGEGRFALTGGTVGATHLGPYMGQPPSGRAVGISVMDFYRLDDDGRIAENWLPIDMAGLLAQFGRPIL